MRVAPHHLGCALPLAASINHESSSVAARDRSNASSEVEYVNTWAVRVGAPGRGVRTIMDMVHHTRLDCTFAAAGLMRQACRVLRLRVNDAYAGEMLD